MLSSEFYWGFNVGLAAYLSTEIIKGELLFVTFSNLVCLEGVKSASLGDKIVACWGCYFLGQCLFA